ncbi:hypothetical protein DAPPUDRAFT_112421 [Daphnia pulex]|uniref:Uncharacterized protein n=1 Tax=Daphnia pulex TaxID=6669 RepID=E9HC02_DAPPU|nr:hypothetical protein DAPPUDRAFT_112421 [Daphnia pulex]|eukprot:EFX70745.1 hypothetical protein DAPPUDRAFT_112421 [Daphnia pulex]
MVESPSPANTTSSISTEAANEGNYSGSDYTTREESQVQKKMQGEKFTLTWTTDENGFQPRGDHLPVAPVHVYELPVTLPYHRSGAAFCEGRYTPPDGVEWKQFCSTVESNSGTKESYVMDNRVRSSRIVRIRLCPRELGTLKRDTYTEFARIWVVVICGVIDLCPSPKTYGYCMLIVFDDVEALMVRQLLNLKGANDLFLSENL